MARIAGRFTADPADHASQSVYAMLACMASGTQPSRGQPSVVRHGNVALGCSTTGSMASNHKVMVAIDGVLVNAKDLPGGAGAEPAAQVADLYQRHGMVGTLERLDGDFSIVLYDKVNGELWLARDRIGVKPLYYTHEGTSVSVASRIGGLLALPGTSRQVNRRWAAVFAGSHYRYIDNHPDESPFLGISQVPAGTALRFAGDQPQAHRYWTLQDKGDSKAGEAELAEQYRAMLTDAVRARVTTSDRPAFTLSGGMDSSSIMASAMSITGGPMHAFSTVYSDNTYDESAEIAGFIKDTGAHWHPIRVEGFDLFETVRKMVRVHDEPVATATWLSHFLLCEQVAGAGFGTIFGGLGGDELNAGEHEYFVFHFADLVAAGRGDRLPDEIAHWAKYHDHPIHRKDAQVAAALMAKLTDPALPGRIRVEQARFTRYFPAVSRDYFDLAGFEPVLDHPFSTCLKNRTYQDILRETAPCCLRAEDRDCEAFGLRHSDPFFDHRLVEFMFQVPGHMKIRDGVTKQLLRQAMKGVLPEETRARVKKTGWNAPAHLWFSERGLDQLEDLVRSREFRERGIYDVDHVLGVMKEHREIVSLGAARENHMMFLWQLLNLEMWFREVADAPAPKAPAGP
jgi:asparagine synthase (glutamine-hydrolysing)